jgi:hypothetical protein
MASKLLEDLGQVKFTSNTNKPDNVINTQMLAIRTADIKNPEALLTMGKASIPAPILVPTESSALPKTLLVFIILLLLKRHTENHKNH